YVHPAKSAVEAQAADSLQRSRHAPIGIRAANPTLKFCRPAAREIGAPSNSIPRRKNEPRASQFHCRPATTITCAGAPIYPCQAKPQMTYTPAATAKMQSEVSRQCAALRERPSPVLISESPATEKGARRIRTMRRPISAVEMGKSTEVTLFPGLREDSNG